MKNKLISAGEAGLKPALSWPSLGYASRRAFKARKRFEARYLSIVLEKLNECSAYTPVSANIDELRESIATMRKKLSARRWGR